MIIVNGKEINLTEDTTVAEYLEQNQYQVKRIAVEFFRNTAIPIPC